MGLEVKVELPLGRRGKTHCKEHGQLAKFTFLTWIVFTQGFDLWYTVNIVYLCFVYFSVCALHFGEKLPSYLPLSKHLSSAQNRNEISQSNLSCALWESENYIFHSTLQINKIRGAFFFELLG